MNNKFKIEKLHDMINGFTILLIKIKYNEFCSKNGLPMEQNHFDCTKFDLYLN